MGKSCPPPLRKLKQTPETFEQGGSSVNDLWIQGVSHLPEWVSPFRKLLLLTPPSTPTLIRSYWWDSRRPWCSLRNVEWPQQPL